MIACAIFERIAYNINFRKTTVTFFTYVLFCPPLFLFEKNEFCKILARFLREVFNHEIHTDN